MAAHGAAFDLVVIGSGPAGRRAAVRAAKLEKSVRKKNALYPTHQAQSVSMGTKRCDRMSVIGPESRPLVVTARVPAPRLQEQRVALHRNH